MTTSWKITHDPLRLMDAAAAFALREEEAREQGEDIIQAERRRPGKKKEVLDLGWYQDRYLIFLVEDVHWDSPIRKIEYHDLSSAMTAFRTLTV